MNFSLNTKISALFTGGNGQKGSVSSSATPTLVSDADENKSPTTALVVKSANPSNNSVFGFLRNTQTVVPFGGGTVNVHSGAVAAYTGDNILKDICLDKRQQDFFGFFRKVNSLNAGNLSENVVAEEVSSLRQQLQQNPTLYAILYSVYVGIEAIKNPVGIEYDRNSNIFPDVEVFRGGDVAFFASLDKSRGNNINLIDISRSNGKDKKIGDVIFSPRRVPLGVISEHILSQLFAPESSDNSGVPSSSQPMSKDGRLVIQGGVQDYIKITIKKFWECQLILIYKRLCEIKSQKENDLSRPILRILSERCRAIFNPIYLRLNDVEKVYFLKNVVATEVLEQFAIHAEDMSSFCIWCGVMEAKPDSLAYIFTELTNRISYESYTPPLYESKIIYLYAKYSEKINTALCSEKPLEYLGRKFPPAFNGYNDVNGSSNKMVDDVMIEEFKGLVHTSVLTNAISGVKSRLIELPQFAAIMNAYYDSRYLGNKDEINYAVNRASINALLEKKGSKPLPEDSQIVNKNEYQASLEGHINMDQFKKLHQDVEARCIIECCEETLQDNFDFIMNMKERLTYIENFVSAKIRSTIGLPDDERHKHYKTLMFIFHVDKLKKYTLDGGEVDRMNDLVISIKDGFSATGATAVEQSSTTTTTRSNPPLQIKA